MKRFQHAPKCGFADFHVFFMNITVKTVHIFRFTDRYYLWNDTFSVLSQKFCPFKGFLDLVTVRIASAEMTSDPWFPCLLNVHTMLFIWLNQRGKIVNYIVYDKINKFNDGFIEIPEHTETPEHTNNQ